MAIRIRLGYSTPAETGRLHREEGDTMKKPRRPKKAREEPRESIEPREPEVETIPWWRDWRALVLTVVVLAWAVSLVTVTINDALHPPTQEELLQK